MVGTIFCFIHRRARLVICLAFGAVFVLGCRLVLHFLRHLLGV